MHKTGNSFIKGTYSAAFARLWMTNVGKEDELKTLFRDFNEIDVFINKELPAIKEGFENAVLLIENLAGQP